MSETVRYKGKITPVYPLEGETLEDTAERILEENLIDKKDYYDSCSEQLYEDLYEQYEVINGLIYKLGIERKDPNYTFFEASSNDDGSFDIHVMYYNGGCGLGEAIENAVNQELYGEKEGD